MMFQNTPTTYFDHGGMSLEIKNTTHSISIILFLLKTTV